MKRDIIGITLTWNGYEIPGITPEVAGFARRVSDDGFTAYLPNMFGEPGKPFSLPYVAGQMARACISREFSVLAKGQSSPITDWLRALCRKAHEECGGPGVGAIGMCLTGNFALSLMVDDAVTATEDDLINSDIFATQRIASGLSSFSARSKP